MTRLTLYTTLGCHLCERLETLLAVLHRGEYRLERVEISDDTALMARYAVRIPVLADAAGDELDMGFEPPRLAAWLEARGRLDSSAWRRLQAGGLELEPEPSPAREREPLARRPAGRRYLG
ncbi:glutaredoxin family protein [Halomonas sp. MCCC 1A17488]|uniref:Glutaredoxin family protein n=1 Tax=Billgrantia sulfidoxydans TaxID=2733484 RepID=A0ABX7W3K3_9GAMM|nr:MULTISPECIES: glutaredoxin family protein [Halomonas]MCE8015818.1 glutaredoxin family protein [Halomonas sp. MCCC 1A17488]MCG3239151.1 glutaredoxin family protein [Halomonas sp. MCCC 1A17488]QPP50906.1 glutaredoxin family protein [Halomonas sp. SS10-MC5]QTP54431.1 glutaredoxin family protein [Halomonas sulfidoxydans]